MGGEKDLAITGQQSWKSKKVSVVQEPGSVLNRAVGSGTVTREEVINLLASHDDADKQVSR